MKKKQEIIALVIFWVLFFLMEFWYSYLIDSNQNPKQWQILQTIGFMGLQLLIFFLNYTWIGPKTILERKWGKLLVGQIFLILLFPTLRSLYEEHFLFAITGFHNYHPSSIWTPFYYLDNTYYSIRIILFSLVFYSIKISFRQQSQIKELQLAHKQAELQNLKNQLSPHFLFNTLNSFYSDLIDVKPDTAKDVLKLSEMLRYVTYEHENDEVSVKSEIEFLQNYIDLFNRRFDRNLFIEFDYSHENSQTKIPSLLLIHFVENALKHGISNDPEKPIQIRLEIENNQLFFKVKNHFMEQRNYDISGIGYKNIEKRLQFLYPKNHKLRVDKNQNVFEVELMIPVK